MKTKRILIASTFAVFFAIVLYAFSPFRYWGGGYQTQKILFRNKQSKHITIEYQIQKTGMIKANERIVKVSKGATYNYEEQIDTTKIDLSKWERVNEYVN